MILINILLFLGCVYVYGQNTECNICIIDHTCNDDAVSFNLSISNACESPMGIYYSYDTELYSNKRYVNATINCNNCYYELDVNIERDAWDYTLTIESPKSTDVCSIHTARCGGDTSIILWYITGGLSGLFTILGVAVCTVRCYRTHRHTKLTERKIRAAVIND